MNKIMCLCFILCVGRIACADIIVTTDTATGTRNDLVVGIQFSLNTSLPAFTASSYTLNSFTFQQGGAADSSTLWLDIYEAPISGAPGTVSWEPGSENTTGLTYLGSSDSSADWSGGAGNLTYTFTGITLTADREIFVAISSDNVAGSFVQPQHRSTNDAHDLDSEFSNLLVADYAELFDDNANKGVLFSIDVTAVPEPSSVALLGLAGLAFLMFRRKR